MDHWKNIVIKKFDNDIDNNDLELINGIICI